MIPAKIVLLIPKLATPHDGELVATRDAIGRLLRAAGLDWHTLAEACRPPSPPASASRNSSYSPRAHAPSFGDMARACRDLDCGRLTPRERAFVQQMCAYGFNRRPSSRQEQWLGNIFDRLNAGRAAA